MPLKFLLRIGGQRGPCLQDRRQRLTGAGLSEPDWVGVVHMLCWGVGRQHTKDLEDFWRDHQALEKSAGYSGAAHLHFFFFYVFSQTQSLVDHMKTVSQERVPFLATLQVLCKAACPFDLAGLWLTNYGGKSALQHHKCLSKLMGRISYYLLPR